MIWILENTSVLTEDSRNIVLWVILAVAALTAIIISSVLASKNKHDDDDE